MVTLNDKILLLKPDVRDLEELYVLKNDEETNALIGGFTTGFSREMIRDWILLHINAPDEVPYVIQDLGSNKLIGHVGLYKIDYRIRKAEFAILIGDKEARGKGYGKQCTDYMVRYAFEQLNLNKVELSVLSTNERAIYIYRTYGFETEGVLRQAQYKNGRYHDVILMAKFNHLCTYMEQAVTPK